MLWFVIFLSIFTFRTALENYTEQIDDRKFIKSVDWTCRIQFIILNIILSIVNLF